MRWLFLIALFFNLAYIAWQMLVPVTDLYADIPVLKDVEPILLLTELEQRKKIDSVSETVDQVQKPVELDAKAETVSVEGLISDQAGIEQQAIVEEVVAETKDDVTPVLKEPVLTEEPQVTPAETESCFTLGPFRDLEKLRRLTQEIKSYVVKVDFRGQEESQLSVYWVYLPPEKSRKQAIKTAKRLKDKKIKDYYIVREGEKNNGISLGYFKSKNRAFRLKKKIKRLGFNVMVEPTFKTYTVYWLDYQLAGRESIPEEIIEEYGQSKAGKTNRLSRDCGS